MRHLTQLDHLTIWEAGVNLHPLDQILLVLANAEDVAPQVELQDWPLGRRNCALAAVRRMSFGTKMRGWAACPCCSDRLEFELNLDEFFVSEQLDKQLGFRGHAIRLLTSRDLAAVAFETDPDIGARKILTRCFTGECKESEWTASEVAQAGELLSKADPFAETRLELSCESCGHKWDTGVDIGHFLWQEIAASAKRLLADVHVLATAYGWSEREILSLSDERRAHYTRLVQA